MRAYRACAAGLLSLACWLGGCGGGQYEFPVALPSSIAITAADTADIDGPVVFGSDVADVDGLSYRWDFGDGTSSDEAAPSHRFTSTGEFDVTLTVSNEFGDSRRTTFKVTVGHFAMVKDRVCSAGDLKGWCWQQPHPTGNFLEDMAFVDASTGWVVGWGGEILTTRDGGAHWTRQASRVRSNLTRIRFIDASTGWIAGADGVVLRTTDAGANWVKLPDIGVQARDDDLGLVVLDGQRAVVIPDSGLPRATLDGGATWADASLLPEQVTEDGTLWDVDRTTVRKAGRLGLDAPTLSFATDEHQVSQFTMGTARDGLLLLTDDWPLPFQQLLRTTDGGVSWTTVAAVGLPSGVTDFKLFGASEAWAVASRQLYRSTDAGLSWSLVTLPAGALPTDLNFVHAEDAKTLWFRHDGGSFLTRDGGASWVWLRVEEEDDGGDLAINAGGIWMWQSGTSVYKSLDTGQQWQQVLGIESSNGFLMTSVWFFDSQRGMALSFAGGLMDTTNGGRDWTPRQAPADPPDYSFNGRLHFASESLGWRSGIKGIYKTTDGGATWRLPVTDAPMFNVTDYTFVDARNGWAVTDEQYVVGTVDGGESWTLLSTGPYGSLKSVAFADARTGVVAGSAGLMLRTTDGGITWQACDTGVDEYIHQVRFVSSTTGWAVATSGVVLTTTDAGATWSRVPVPTDAFLLGLAFADADHGWIFGQDGTVLATGDGGKTWTIQASGVARTLIGGFFLDANTGWMFGSGNLLATATGGR